MKKKERLDKYRKMNDTDLREEIKKLQLGAMKESSIWGKEKQSAHIAGRPTKGNSALKNLRREVARINTIISERRNVDGKT